KNYDEAKKILNRNLEYFRQTGDLYGIIVSLIKLGKLGYYLGANSYKTSQKNLINALDLISILKDKNFLSVKAELKWECYLYLGKTNLLTNNYKEAEDYLFKSIEELRLFELGESLNEAKILKNLAKLYEIKGEYQNAIDYNKLSNEIYDKFGDDYKVAQLLRKIARIYLVNIENEFEAIKKYEKALEIFEDQNYFKESADVLHRLGDIYVNKGSIKIALSNWEKAKRYYADLLDEVNLNLINEKIKSLINSNSESF
ncbi:MAG: tetratricopeptide repeat protein, partial [Promethearchaeota archaeon]